MARHGKSQHPQRSKTKQRTMTDCVEPPPLPAATAAMSSPPPTPQPSSPPNNAGRRRNRAALQTAAAVLLCGAAILGLNEAYSKGHRGSASRNNDPTKTQQPPPLRSLKVETIEPGRHLHASYLTSHLEHNPAPNTGGHSTASQCESHYSPQHDDWYHPEPAVPVPPDSKFATNNNFDTHVDFNGLNVLFVGDSVGENMALFFANAHKIAGMDGMEVADRLHFAQETNLEGRTQDTIWVNEIPEERGGGYVAFGRVLRFWHGDEMDLTHQDFVKWDPTNYDKLKHQYGEVDVLIYRTPWPWMVKTGRLGNIVEDDYYRVLEVARRMVNPRTVIFATSAINNNALKMDGFESLRRDNDVLRRFVNGYKIPSYSNRGVQNVLLMDWEKLTDALVLANAATMDIPPEMAFKHQVSCHGLSKRHAFTGTRYCPHLTAMACAGTTAPNHPSTIQTCVEDKRGRISPDGMHWCDATTGPRTAGGIVCLTKCAITADMSFEEDADREQRKAYLMECQDRCNALWMNLDSYYIGEGDGHGHLELPTTPELDLP